jgi:hypothetical protein
MENVGIFCGHLRHITATWYILWPFGISGAIWYIAPHFGIFYHEKSGNPVINFKFDQFFVVSFGKTMFTALCHSATRNA